MNFWWVNHKQTFSAEVNEGYIWSPKTKRNGKFNQSYKNLQYVQIGDTIFSYASGKIAAVGIAKSVAQDFPKPSSFGKAGEAWDDAGWLIEVNWSKVENPVFPKQHIAAIAPLLPEMYSPIRKTGDGNQGIYLASISKKLGNKLLTYILEKDSRIGYILSDTSDILKEDEIENEIESSDAMPTVRTQLIEARVGQGIFRTRVEGIEKGCRVTGLNDKLFLIASHIKPWRDSNDTEKLDGNNGLLLSPHVDKLFDKGHITFAASGEIDVASKEVAVVLKQWHLDVIRNVGPFNPIQKEYLEYHRKEVFRKKFIN